MILTILNTQSNYIKSVEYNYNCKVFTIDFGTELVAYYQVPSQVADLMLGMHITEFFLQYIDIQYNYKVLRRYAA